MATHLTTQELRQGSAGFHLRLDFELKGFTDSYLGQTWRVRIICPDGTALLKTTGIEFLANTPKICVPIDDFDLVQAGTYYYQVSLITGGANVNSSVESFEIEASLPEGLEYSVISSSMNHFPIFNSGGGLTASNLYVDADTDLNYASGGIKLDGDIELINSPFFYNSTKDTLYFWDKTFTNVFGADSVIAIGNTRPLYIGAPSYVDISNQRNMIEVAPVLNFTNPDGWYNNVVGVNSWVTAKMGTAGYTGSITGLSGGAYSYGNGYSGGLKLTGIYGTVYVRSMNETMAIAGSFDCFVGGGGGGVNNTPLYGILAKVQGGHNGTTPLQVAGKFHVGTIGGGGVGIINEGRGVEIFIDASQPYTSYDVTKGIALQGWTAPLGGQYWGTSFAIYADETIDIANDSYFIFSTASSPSLFGGMVEVPHDDYNAATWTDNLYVPTKKAIRDKIETIMAGGMPIDWNGTRAIFYRTAITDDFRMELAPLATPNGYFKVGALDTAIGTLEIDKALGRTYLTGATVRIGDPNGTNNGTYLQIVDAYGKFIFECGTGSGIIDLQTIAYLDLWDLVISGQSIDAGGLGSFEIPNSTAPSLTVNGQIAVDTSVADFSHGILKYYGGEQLGVVAMPIAAFTAPTDGYVVKYNATNDEFELGIGGMVTGTPVVGGGANRVLFQDSSSNLATASDFLYNSSTKLLSTRKITLGDHTAWVDTGTESPTYITVDAYVSSTTNNHNYGILAYEINYNGTGTGANLTGFSGYIRTGPSAGVLGTIIGASFYSAPQSSGQGAALAIGMRGVSGAFNAGGAVTTAEGFRGGLEIYNGGSVGSGSLFRGYVTHGGTGNVTNLYGLNLSGWTAIPAVNSYGIYMDASIDRGSTLKYAIYSLSTSPSVLTGSLSVPDDAYGVGWGANTTVPTKNAVYGKIESLSFPPTIGGSVAFGSVGSVLFVGSGGLLAQDNTNFNWDNTNKKLTIKSASSAIYSEIFNFTATNNAQTRFMENYAVYSGTGTGHKVWSFYSLATSNSAVKAASIIGAQIFATAANGGPTGGSSLVVGVDSTAGAGNFGGVVDVAYAVKGTINSYNNSEVTLGSMFKGFLTDTSASAETFGEIRGLDLSGWAASSSVDKSYGIYMDASIDVGVSLKYALYSLSTSQSLLSGKLNITSTTEQLRLNYNSTNYFKVTVDSTGSVAFDNVGSGTMYNFSNTLVLDKTSKILSLSGPAATLSQMPRMNFMLNGDADAVISYLTYDHGNLALTFDSYHNGGGWVSSHVGANFALYKVANELVIGYNSGTTKGTGFGGFNLTNGVIFSNDGKLGIGTSPFVKLHVLSTTTQFAAAYDASNYFTATVGSTGTVTFDAVGSGSGFTFSDSVAITNSLAVDSSTLVVDSTTHYVGIGTVSPTSKFQIGPAITGIGQIKTMAVKDSTTADYANLAQFDSSVSTTRAGFILSNSSSAGDWSNNFLQFGVHGGSYPYNYYLTNIPSKTSDALYTYMWTQGSTAALALFTYTAAPVYLGTSNAVRLTVASGGDVGINTTAPSAKLHVMHTLEQLRIGYDTSNYMSVYVEYDGRVNFDVVGSGDKFLFNNPVNVPDDPFSATWAGSSEVPTKADLYPLLPSGYEQNSNDTRSKVVFFEDLVNPSGFTENGWVFGVSQAGMHLVPDMSLYPNAVGVVSLRFNTVSTNNVSMMQSNAAASSVSSCGRLGAGLNIFTFRFSTTTLSNGTDTYTFYVGVANGGNLNTPTRGCFFRYTDSVNSGKWEAVCVDGGGTTAVDTGVTVTASTTMKTYEVRVNAAATQAKFYINGTLVATVTTNIPTGSSDTVGGMLSLRRSAGTTATSEITSIDYARAEWNFTTPR